MSATRLDEATPAVRAPAWPVALRRFALPLVVLVGVLGAWELLVRALEVPAFIVPPPSAVVRAFLGGVLSGTYFLHLAVTAAETVLGFLAGSALGLFLGILIVVFPTLERILYPYIVALQTIPKVAIAPLMVVWFGFGMLSKVLVVALVALFPVLVNVIAGLRAVDQDRLDMLAALSASRWQVFRYLRFPNSLPFLFAGLNTAIVFSVIGAIVGEFVGANRGIGFLILQANYQLDIAGAFALFAVLSILGVALHWLIRFIERKSIFWTARDDSGGL